MVSLILAFVWMVGASLPALEPQLLAPGTTVERAMAGGESHAYHASVEAGRPLLLAVEQQGIDVVVAAAGPSGLELPPLDSPNGRQGPEYLVLPLDAPGEYRVEIRSPTRFVAAGRYTLRCIELPRETPTERQRLAAFTRMTEAARLYRQGTAGGRRAAVTALEDALAAWRALGQTREEAETLSLLAAAHRRLGEPRPALALFRQALTLRLALADKAGQAEALLGAGLAQWELGDNAAATGSLGQALAGFQAGGDRAGAAAAENNLCLIHLSTGELAAAGACFERVRAELEALGDRGREGAALNSLGGVSEGLGEPLQAREQYESALTIFRETGDLRGESQALNNLAGIDVGLGEMERGLEVYAQALALFRQLGDRFHESSALNNLGWVYLGLGELERARPYLDQALELRRELGDRRGEAASLINLGLVLSRLDDPQTALDFYGQALHIASEVGDRATECTARELIARVQLDRGEVGSALTGFSAALSLAHTMGDRSREAQALVQLGRAQAAAGQGQEALSSLAAALDLQRAVRDPVHEIETLTELARCEHRGGLDERAMAHVDEAMALLESIRTRVTNPDLRAAFLAARQGAFELAIAMRMGRGQAREAFAVSERARARSLIDLLGEAGARVRRGIAPELLRRESEVLGRLDAKALRQTRLLSAPHTARQEAEARNELAALLAEDDRIKAEIRRQSPHYAAYARPSPLGAAEIRALLDPDTLLLEVTLGEERSFLFAVSSEAVAGFALPGRAAIEAPAAELLRRLRGRESEVDPAAELSRLILGPAAGLLADRRLVIVADGVLQLIPFAMLPDPAAPGEPLLARHEILSLPSASMLAVQRQELAGRPPAPKTLAVLADPVFDRHDSRLAVMRTAGSRNPDPDVPSGFSRLPATRREAEAIAALVAAGQVFSALGFDASRETVERPEMALYRIVHFATHSVLDTRAPSLSGLVLSLVDKEGRPQNGFLGLGDVYNLRLDADLVVLSGCQTALGKTVRGEGLIGLSQGFFYAGARRILASLWRVEDPSTAELITLFYRALLGGGLAPPAALRQAQLAIRREAQRREPYYWAPFILQGDWR